MDKEARNLKSQLDILDGDIENFTRELNRFINQGLTLILRNIERPDRKTLEVAKALGSLLSSLNSMGLDSVIQKVTKVYSNQLKVALDQLSESAGKKVTFTDVDLQVTEQLVKLDRQLITNQVGDLTTRLSSAVMRQVIIGETPNVSEIVSESTDKSIANIKTELNTAAIGFSRSITQAKAEELGLDLFLYVGVVDKVTRPFCRSKVGKIFTKDDVSRWDNGQGIPAAIYLGGYNCRHQLRPISRERAKELGYVDKA